MTKYSLSQGLVVKRLTPAAHSWVCSRACIVLSTKCHLLKVAVQAVWLKIFQYSFKLQYINAM